MLHAIDLFSGIGGFSFALADVITTVLYCECDENAKNVLKNNMNRKLLPKAEICPDIRVLDKEWMYSHKIPHFDFVFAGFPCVGLSAAGAREGFANPQTRLFFDLMHVIDAATMYNFSKPPCVFMENVPRITEYDGIVELVKEFVVKRKYALRWCTFDAADIGAPQKRRRWYCVAIPETNRLNVLNSRIDEILQRMSRKKPYVWKSEPIRMTASIPIQRETETRRNIRISLLGNAVIPEAIRAAFLFLMKTLRHEFQIQFEDKKKILGIVSGLQAAYVIPKHVRESQFTKTTRKQFKETVITFPASGPLFNKRINYDIVLDPSTYKPYSKNIAFREKNKTQIVPSPVRKTHWATVTKTDGQSGTCRFLTKRALNKIKTQVRFGVNTPNATRDGQLSPVFTEWLMGFPIHWTRS